jgi:hypothetical protein
MPPIDSIDVFFEKQQEKFHAPLFRFLRVHPDNPLSGNEMHDSLTILRKIIIHDSTAFCRHVP